MPQTRNLEELSEKVDKILNNHIPHLETRLNLLERESLLSRPDALISCVAMLGGFGLFILSYISSVWQFAFLGSLLIAACSIHLTTLKRTREND